MAHVLTRYDDLFDATIWWVVPVVLVVLAAFGLYQRLWTFIGQRDYEAVVKGVIVATLLIVGAIALLHPVQTSPQFVFRHHRHAIQSSAVVLPASVIALFMLMTLALLVGARFLVHLIVEGRVRSFRVSKGARDVLIVGGGDGGRLVVRELVRNPQLRLRPVGFIDDDPRKQGMKDEYGLKVLGTTTSEDLARVLDEAEPDEVVIAIPSAPGTLRARVVTACRERGIPVRTTPTVFELLKDGSGQLRVTRQLREVRVEDILGREPVRIELERVGAYLAGEVVLVTGAGGSIGGELCRQIARVGPRRLVLVDHAEDNLFEIMRELEEDRHVRTAVPVLADCKEEERMREVLSEHQPDRDLPRRRLQARDDDGAQPRRGDPQQRARDAGGRADRRRARRRHVRARLDRQGGQPGDRDGRVEGARRVGGRGRRGTLPDDDLLDRAVRQRARVVGLGGPDLPPPDRRRRSGDRHRRADDAATS